MSKRPPRPVSPNGEAVRLSRAYVAPDGRVYVSRRAYREALLRQAGDARIDALQRRDGGKVAKHSYRWAPVLGPSGERLAETGIGSEPIRACIRVAVGDAPLIPDGVNAKGEKVFRQRVANPQGAGAQKTREIREPSETAKAMGVSIRPKAKPRPVVVERVTSDSAKARAERRRVPVPDRVQPAPRKGKISLHTAGETRHETIAREMIKDSREHFANAERTTPETIREMREIAYGKPLAPQHDHHVKAYRYLVQYGAARDLRDILGKTLGNY